MIDELERYKKEVKESIQALIKSGMLEEAEKILISGLAIYGANFDLLYNLGYLYQTMDKNELAIEFYKKALQNARDENGENEAYEMLKALGVNEDTFKHNEGKPVDVKTVDKYIKKQVNSRRKTPAVTIITYAYNVEKYIKECIESVLNQSFTDFEWVILDNGCTDGTSEMLKKYAQKDSRIKLFRNERNSVIYGGPNNSGFTGYINNLKSEYMCSLDSDDYLHPDFLRELYTTAKNNNADIVISGTEMFYENNPQHRKIRMPPSFFTDDITKVGDIFPQIYDCFRTLWGKLVRTPINYLSRKYFLHNKMKMVSGADTIQCLYYLRFSNSVASVDKLLHYYRIRENSFFYSNVNKNRYLNNLKIFNESKNLLISWNKLSNDNLNFLAQVLYYSLTDCITIAANAVKVPVEDRIEIITTILSDINVKKIIDEAGLLNNLLVEAIKGLNDIAQRYRNC